MIKFYLDLDTVLCLSANGASAAEQEEAEDRRLGSVLGGQTVLAGNEIFGGLMSKRCCIFVYLLLLLIPN